MRKSADIVSRLRQTPPRVDFYPYTGFLTGVTVAPLTTSARDIPTEVLLTLEEDDVKSLCVVNCDNIQTIQKN